MSVMEAMSQVCVVYSPQRSGVLRAGTEHIRSLAGKALSIACARFGSMTAREFFLYQSRLSPKGSTYTKLARFDLA